MKTVPFALLEQLKTTEIAGQTLTLTRLTDYHSAFVTRDLVAKLKRKRARQLAEIKRDCARLRGLLRDLD